MRPKVERKNKWCPGCETSYPLDVFHKNQGYCPTCKHKYDVERRSKIKVTGYDKFKRWQQHLKKRYKMTLLDVENLYMTQNGLCPICNKQLENPALEETVRFSMSIDHDHACCPGDTTCGNCIRGLLCRDCNLMIGHAKDNLDTLKKAVEYLETTSKKVGTQNL